jgi:hypothetical protein
VRQRRKHIVLGVVAKEKLIAFRKNRPRQLLHTPNNV